MGFSVILMAEADQCRGDDVRVCCLLIKFRPSKEVGRTIAILFSVKGATETKTGTHLCQQLWHLKETKPYLADVSVTRHVAMSVC
jgi:hypothetical protein